MTVAELSGSMSSAELTMWVAHDALTAADAEHENAMAEQRAKRRR